MADTVEDPQLHNGVAQGESETQQHLTPEPQSDHDPQLQTEAKLTDEIPEIETDSKPEEVQFEVTETKPEEVQSEVTDSKPEEVQSQVIDAKPEEVETKEIDAKAEVNDVDLSPGGSGEISIRPTEADQETTHTVLKKEDEGNKTFTMRELLSELKSEEGDGTPHSSVSPYRFLSLFFFKPFLFI